MTRTAPTTDLGALRSAILADPADDTLRLAYADALQEQHSEDSNEYRHGELIRLQCRIATIRASCGCGSCVKVGQHHNGPCAVSKERDELPDGRSKNAMLRPREQDLLRDLTPWLRRGERCGACHGTGDLRTSDGKFWLGQDCHHCNADGWLGSLAEQMPHIDQRTGPNWEKDWRIPAG